METSRSSDPRSGIGIGADDLGFGANPRRRRETLARLNSEPSAVAVHFGVDPTRARRYHSLWKLYDMIMPVINTEGDIHE
jgi:hypothetical protein